MYDLLLKGAHVVDPLNDVNGVTDVAIVEGKIAAVAKELDNQAKEVIDLTGYVLQPGIIDSHVHLGTMWGSPFGPRMLAMNGVTTCLDMAGPLDDILDNVPKYGTGINMAILQFASPPFTFKTNAPSKTEMIELIDKSLHDGALGVKLLGGHYPLKPDVSSTLIKTALERRAYVAWHAGTSENGSNINGMIEAVEMADGYPLHLAHINAYCRGAIKNELEELIATNLASSKTYTNEEVGELHTYVDTTKTNLKNELSNLIASSNSTTLNSAKLYTDSKVSEQMSDEVVMGFINDKADLTNTNQTIIASNLKANNEQRLANLENTVLELAEQMLELAQRIKGIYVEETS